MNPGWVLMCIGMGLMLGGFIAFERQAPDSMRAIISSVTGFLVFLLGHLIYGYVAEEQKAVVQARVLNLESVLPKKKRYSYRGVRRAVVILGPLVGLGILAVALSSAFSQGPIFDGRF